MKKELSLGLRKLNDREREMKEIVEKETKLKDMEEV